MALGLVLCPVTRHTFMGLLLVTCPLVTLRGYHSPQCSGRRGPCVLCAQEYFEFAAKILFRILDPVPGAASGHSDNYPGN